MKLSDKEHPTILFEDNHLLVVDKPHGMLTQPDDTRRASLEAICKTYIKKRDEKTGGVYLHAVHRIDKPVAGVIVFAKTSKALSRLQESQRNKQWKKEYIALVEGNPGDGEYEDLIEKGDGKAFLSKKGKSSRLFFHTEDGVVHITLETGRYHQIRVQFAARKHPIIGDTKYGSSHSYPHGIALVHKAVTFPHPVQNKTCSYTSTIKLKQI